MESVPYELGKELGEMKHIRLYECCLPDGGVSILKLALDPIGDGLLDREALILTAMAKEAKRLEEAYAKNRKSEEDLLNYDLAFPNLVESYVAQENDRRVNVVNFPAVPDDLSRLIPLENLWEQSRMRVDPRTSAWMMGKLLKLIAFAHNQGIAIGQLDGGNILIEKDQHYVIIFDWTRANNSFVGRVPAETACEEISQAARMVITALGGDLEKRELIPDPQLEDSRYAEFLFDLATGNSGDAFYVHGEFYRLIRSLWPREFHPFTGYDLD